MSGSRADPFRVLRARLVADHPLQVPHQQREGMRADDRADDVVGVAHAGGPVAERLVHGFLQRAGAGHDRHDLRTEQLHPRDVGRLPMCVLLAHVHDARESKQRARRGGGDAVLTGSRLRDDPLLAQPFRDQRLAERVVDLVGARVRQVLALQPDLVAELRGQPARMRDRRGTPDEVTEQVAELRAEPGIVPELRPCGGELVQGRDQDLGHEPSPVGAEPAAVVGDRNRPLCHRAHRQLSSPSSSRSLAPGSSARISASPTRMADAPASTAARTCARVAIPLSITLIRPPADAGQMRERTVHVDLERLQVSRVHAYDLRVRREHLVQVLIRVGLHESAQTQIACGGQHRGELVRREAGRDQQDGVRPRRPGLDQLGRMDQEVFA